MPQAIVDPEELRQFARNLQRFNQDLQDRLTALAGQLAALGKTWRDQEQNKFVEEFEQQAKGLARFIELSEQHIPYLLDLTDAEASLVGRMVLVANKLAMEQGIADSGYRLVINCGADGGQVVPHLHIHLLGGRKLGALG